MMLASAFERKRPNIPNNFKRFLDDSYGEVGPVVNQSGYVVLRHFGQLLLENTF